MRLLAPAPDAEVSSDQTTSAARRLRVALHRDSLTRQLANGDTSDATPELKLRARQLTSPRSRAGLARGLRNAVKEAHQPPWSRGMTRIVSRRAVLNAAEEIDLLVKHLYSPEPVTPQGMALVHQILADGASSPLYGSGHGDALRQSVSLATAALGSADRGPALLAPQLRDGALVQNSR
jgi:hypothetical protein